MAITARTLIKDTLTLLRVIGAADTPDPDDQGDAFRALNYLVGTLNSKGLMKPVTVAAPYTLTENVGTYTIGPTGATLTGARPNVLTHATIVPSGQTFEVPLDLLSKQQWQQERSKAQTGEPWAVRYEPTPGNGTLYVLWVPNRDAEIRLYHQQAISRFATLDTVYTFEDGWEEMLLTNLAKRVAARFGKRLDPDHLEIAISSLYTLTSLAEADAVPELQCHHADQFNGVWDPSTGDVI